MERAQNVSPTPGSVTSLTQGMLGPSTDNGASKMPPTVRRDEIITHSGKLQVKLMSWFNCWGQGP